MRCFLFPLPNWVLALVLLAAVGHENGQAASSVEPLGFSGEPVGDEMVLSYHLDADARRLLEREPRLDSLDREATALRRGERVRAFAEAIAAEESDDPARRALSQIRRAWILGELGAVNYGAEHANQALSPATGELHLARAWLRWRAGDFEGADEEAALAASTDPVAPAWALDAWQKHREAVGGAAKRFARLSEPDDSTSPAFLEYAEVARAAGAFNVADEAYFSALNQLQQQRSAEPSTSPEGLFRAAVARRDFLLHVLGSPSPATIGPHLWGTAVAAARTATQFKPDQAAWDRYFSLLDVAQTAVPDFDFTDFDLAGDLALAEAASLLSPPWRERFAALLVRPDIRYASRELQALGRLEAHPAFEFQHRPLDAEFEPAEVEALDRFVRLVQAERQALAALRAELPADTPPGTRELFFSRLLATQSFRLAVARERFDVARQQLEVLQALRTSEGRPVIEAATFAAALPELERRPFYAQVANFAETPADQVDPFALEDLVTNANEFAAWFVLDVGADYATREHLPPDQVVLGQYLAHARLIEAIAYGQTLVTCDRLADLNRWCERPGAPVYPHLAAAKKTVASLPADPMNASKPERELLDFLVAEKQVDATTLAQAEAFRTASPNQLLPALLVAFCHWRLGDEDAAMAVMTQLRQRASAHPPTLEQLAQIERNNSTTLIMQAHLAKLAGATPASHPNEFERARADANSMAIRIRQKNGGTTFVPSKAPPRAREAYAHAATVLSLTRLAEGRLVYPAWTLELLREQNETGLLARLEPAFAKAPFRNDLRTAEAKQVWSELFQALPLEKSEAEALAQRATAFESDSVSIRLAAVALGLRRFNWPSCETFLAEQRRAYGANRAFARQLDLIQVALADCRAMPQTKDAAELRRTYLTRLARLFADLNTAAGL